MRRTFQYTYRSVIGTDVTVTHELLRGESKEKAVATVRKDFKGSVTPLVMLDGKKVDITSFLECHKAKLDGEISRLTLLSERLGRETKRRQME